MPQTVLQTLKAYLGGVVGRANHHAHCVNEIALALAGPIVRRMDDHPIKVMTQGWQTKNVLWNQIGGTKFSYTYTYVRGFIEIREGSTLHSFDNSTALATLTAVFEVL